jgi:hypothetical protein
MEEYEYKCEKDGRELDAAVVYSGIGRCYPLKADKDCLTCQYLKRKR